MRCRKTPWGDFDMSVDNGRVQAIVQQALNAYGPTGDVSTRLDRAWRAVNARREMPGGVNCGDGNLAAADHYLFMRWTASERGPAYVPFLYTLTSTYDGLLKAHQAVFDLLFGGDVVFKTGSCKATGFSLLVLLWAQQGICDGAIDFFRSDDAKLTCPSNPY